MKKEIWKDINGYECIYQVSNLGKVKSLKFGKEKILRACKNRYGYLQVILWNNGIIKSKTIHKLVAEEFILNIYNKCDVNHINGIKTDNRLSNLEWSTRSENIQHAFAIGLCKLGKDHHSSKSVIQYDKHGLFVSEYVSGLEAQKMTNINNGSISNCCYGKLKSAGGYIWKFKKREY